MDRRIYLKNFEKVIRYGCYAYVVLLGCWLFYHNTFFSESYDLLTLREVDDLAFQSTLKRFRMLLSTRDFSHLFSCVDYGYGNIFWLALSFVSYPFYKLGWHEWVMIVPRQISLFAYLLCFYLFHKISQRLNYSKLETAILMVLMSSSSIAISGAGRFHNNTILAALLLGAIYSSLKIEKRNSAYLACFLFGLSAAIKITSLACAPILFLLLNRDLKFQLNAVWNRDVIVRNIKYGAVTFFTFIVSYAPAILALPFGVSESKESFSLLKGYIQRSGDSFGAPTMGFYQTISEGFFQQHFSLEIVVIGICFAFWSIQRQKKRDPQVLIQTILVPLIYLASILVVVYLATKVKNGPSYLAFYTIPFVFILPFVFLEMRKYFAWSLAAVLAVVILGFDSNYVSFRQYLTLYKDRYFSAETQERLSQYKFFKENIQVLNGDNIILDYRIVFPVDIILSNRKIQHLFDDPNPIQWSDYNLFVFNKEADLWQKSCRELYSLREVRQELCADIKNMMAGGPPYEKVFDSEKVFVARRLK